MFSVLHVTHFSFQCNQYKTLSVSSENILRKGNWYAFCGWWNYSTELRMFSLLFGHQDTQPSSSLQTGYVTSICVFSSRGFRASLRLSTASGITSGVCWPIKPPTGLGSLLPTRWIEQEEVPTSYWRLSHKWKEPDYRKGPVEDHPRRTPKLFCAESLKSFLSKALSSLGLKHWPERPEACWKNWFYCFQSWSSHSFNSHYLYSASLSRVFPIS